MKKTKYIDIGVSNETLALLERIMIEQHLIDTDTTIKFLISEFLTKENQNIQKITLPHKSSPTKSEELLWKQLKHSNFKWRRQVPKYGYILDFYCPEIELVVEVDGKVHEYTTIKDKRRDNYLAGRGITTLRITSDKVDENPKKVKEDIENFISNNLIKK
jgi:very-short-patch-repair endonuclease